MQCIVFLTSTTISRNLDVISTKLPYSLGNSRNDIQKRIFSIRLDTHQKETSSEINVFFIGIAAEVGNHKEQAAALAEKLSADGFTVQYGALDYLTADECQHLKTCYANNPSSPYALVYLPPGPGEDISTYPEWGTLKTVSNGKEMSANFRLARKETVIMLGQTPTRSIYYSWVPYVFGRWFPKGWESPEPEREMLRCPTVTDEKGSRCDIFASLGDAINMVTMKTSMENGESFASAFAHLMGGDASQIEKIQEIAAGVGIEESIQNVYPLSSKRVHFGLDRKGDGILHLGRVTFTEDKSAREEMIENPSKFMTILRVTPPEDSPVGDDFPPNVFTDRVTTKEQVLSEGINHEDLQRAVKEDLAEAVKKRYKHHYKHVDSFEVMAPAFKDGYDCIDRGIKCNGDIQDTLYPNSGKALYNSKRCQLYRKDRCPIVRRATLQPDGSDFFLVTGVNHNATGSALYSSMCMYNVARLESIGQFTSMPRHLDPDSYVGSADRFLDSPISKYLFAVKVSRKCAPNEKFCLQVTSSGANSLPLANDCLFIERIYMDEMRAGPDAEATIKPMVYHFSSKRH